MDGTVRIWSVATGAELRAIQGTGYRAAVSLSPDGRWIATGSDRAMPVSINGDDSSARQGAVLWDVDSGEPLHTLSAHKAPVTATTFSADGRWLFTGDDNGVGQLWEAASGRHVGRLDFHMGAITAALFARERRQLFTASTDRSVCVWDVSERGIATPDRRRRLLHPQAVNAMALAPDGRHLFTGCEDGRLRLWDLDAVQEVWMFDAGADAALRNSERPANVNDVALSPEGRFVAIVDGGRNLVRLFEVDYAGGSGRELLAEDAEGSRPLVRLAGDALAWSATFSPDGRHLVTVGGDEARQWDLQGTEVASFGPHRPVTFATFSPDDSLVVTASWDHSARVWNARTGVAVLTLSHAYAGALKGHSATVNSAVFSPSGNHILTASDDRSIRLWETATGKVVQVWHATAGVTRAVFSRDGERFLTASRDGSAALWNISEENPLRQYQGASAALFDIAFSPDEKYVVAGGADSSARVWDAATGEPRLTLVGHSGEVTSVAFQQDSQKKLRVLTGSADQTAKLWDVDSLADASVEPEAKELLTLKGHTRGVTSVAFSPDGRSALTAARDGVAIIWPAVGQAEPFRR
jgi:WD40 repeat protein